MKTFSIITLVLAISFCIILTGCGGGGGKSVLPISGIDELVSNDIPYYNPIAVGKVIHFTCDKNTSVVVSMDSAGSNPVEDPFVGVWKGDSNYAASDTFIGGNDDSNGTKNSRFIFNATKNQTYTVCFRTYTLEYGTYKFNIDYYDGSTAINSIGLNSSKKKDSPVINKFMKN